MLGNPSRSPARTTPTRRRSGLRPKPQRAKSNDRLSSVLASSAFATLVRYFTVAPERAPHLRALIRETGLGVRSVQIELARMEALGLIRRERSSENRHVVIRAVQLHPAWPPLRSMVRILAAPEDVLAMAITGLPHIAAAFIFGSVARGEARAESDCDFMVITDAAATPEEHQRVKADLSGRAGAAGDALGRELSIAIYSMDDFRTRVQTGQGFVMRVLAGAKRWVRGSAHDLAARLDMPTRAIA
jgi:predicted nucleotidyltransferase